MNESFSYLLGAVHGASLRARASARTTPRHARRHGRRHPDVEGHPVETGAFEGIDEVEERLRLERALQAHCPERVVLGPDLGQRFQRLGLEIGVLRTNPTGKVMGIRRWWGGGRSCAFGAFDPLER